MIELNEQEIVLIEKYLNGDLNPFSVSGDEQVAFSKIVDDAEDLMFKLDAIDDASDDIVKWYYDQYKKQQKN